MELISYALDFVSFLAQNVKEMEKINSMILFGSSARGEAGKDSDVDLFIDVIGDEIKIEKEIRKIQDDFFNSVKFKKYWKLFGIENEINIIVGNLDNWGLKDSMLGSSIVLYGAYSSSSGVGKSKAILSWGNVQPNSNRVMLNKKVFGYNYYGKRYKGILDGRGIKIGSNVLLVDIEHLSLFLKLFKEFKVSVKIRRVGEI